MFARMRRRRAWTAGTRGVVEYELHVEVPADEPLLDVSARNGQRQRSDGRQPVGGGDIAALLVEADADLKPLVRY